MANHRPQKIELFPNGELGLVWDDGREAYFSARALRLACPCAQCVDELSGLRRLDPERVPDSIRFLSWAQVGHYAIQFRFTDGHDTGLFSYPYLYELRTG